MIQVKFPVYLVRCVARGLFRAIVYPFHRVLPFFMFSFFFWFFFYEKRGKQEPAEWGAEVGNSWRTTGDIYDSWSRYQYNSFCVSLID
jgi:hypothetical protein